MAMSSLVKGLHGNHQAGFVQLLGAHVVRRQAGSALARCCGGPAPARPLLWAVVVYG